MANKRNNRRVASVTRLRRQSVPRKGPVDLSLGKKRQIRKRYRRIQAISGCILVILPLLNRFFSSRYQCIISKVYYSLLSYCTSEFLIRLCINRYISTYTYTLIQYSIKCFDFQYDNYTFLQLSGAGVIKMSNAVLPYPSFCPQCFKCNQHQ